MPAVFPLLGFQERTDVCHQSGCSPGKKISKTERLSNGEREQWKKVKRERGRGVGRGAGVSGAVLWRAAGAAVWHLLTDLGEVGVTRMIQVLLYAWFRIWKQKTRSVKHLTAEEVSFSWQVTNNLLIRLSHPWVTCPPRPAFDDSVDFPGLSPWPSPQVCPGHSTKHEIQAEQFAGELVHMLVHLWVSGSTDKTWRL